MYTWFTVRERRTPLSADILEELRGKPNPIHSGRRRANILLIDQRYNPPMIRVLIASEYPAMRAGLRMLLGIYDALQVVGEAGGKEELLALAQATTPDVVLLDLGHDGAGMDALWRLRREAPHLSVLALTDSPQDRRTLPALQAGASGCLPKTSTGSELEKAVRAAAAGELILYPGATAALLDRLRGEETLIENLTPREGEVLQWVSAGMTNKAIAYRLGISEHTVKFHLSSVMSKLGAASRAEAVATAIRRGLIAI